MDRNRFWRINDDQVSINLADIIEFLAAEKFGTYYGDLDPTNSDPIVIRENNGILSRFNKTGVVNYCKEHLDASGLQSNLKRKILRQLIAVTKYMKYGDLFLLPKLKPVFVKDDADTSFFYFRNTAIKVSKSAGVVPLKFNELPGVIWDTQIINREFEYINDLYDVFGFPKIKTEFQEFIFDLSDDPVAEQASRLNRHNLLQSIIGYLLHEYKDPSFSKAVVFFDFNPDERKQGGSGKTLLAYSLSYMRKGRIIDGKRFSAKSEFAFAGIDETTKLLIFDDIKENFDLKNLFSIITSGLTVENKFQNSFHIPAEKSPKIVITSNYYLQGISNSFKRRIIEYDFSDYYIVNAPPDKKFGHLLFDGWDNQEWNLFFNLMIYCVQIYFEMGIWEESGSLKRKRISSLTSEDFYFFIDKNLRCLIDEQKRRYNKATVYKEFIEWAGESALGISQNTFTKWLKVYAKIAGYKYTETHSDKEYYFRLE